MSVSFNAIGAGLHAAGPIGYIIFVVGIVGLFLWFCRDARS